MGSIQYFRYYILFCKILPLIGEVLLLHRTDFCFSLGDKGDAGLEGQAGFKGKPGERSHEYKIKPISLLNTPAVQNLY